MADARAVAEVRLFGRTVGAVAELEDDSIVFEFDREFRTSGLELSPMHLPLSLRGPVRFEELRSLPAFRGLPGVLADMLPDSFGRQVIRSYFTAIGEERKAFSPVQSLLYVGDRGIGALEFHPMESLPPTTAEADALEMADLVRDARRVLSGEVDVTLPEIYRIGSSAGGMRPKAVVLWNPERGEIRSAFVEAKPGDRPCILKFDGVDGDRPPGELGRPRPFNRVEHAYSLMARDAGIEAVEIHPISSPDGYVHLMIPRFDLTPQGSLHQHTLGGILHVDYNHPGASSYEEYLRAILRLGMTQDSVTEGFRRAVFNVLAVNQDDHVKNLSFHMDRSGEWSLTPAYDLTFAKGRGFTANHQMRIAGKVAGITLRDLVEMGRTFGIRAPRRIIGEAAAAIDGWPGHAARADVAEDDTMRIEGELRERRTQVGH